MCYAYIAVQGITLCCFYIVRPRHIFAFSFYSKSSIMSGSSHIQSVLVGIEYQNYGQTLDVHLIFAIWMGQIQLKLIYIFVTYGPASL